MSWDEATVKKAKMSSAAPVLTLKKPRMESSNYHPNRSLRYLRKVKHQVKGATMDVFSPILQIAFMTFIKDKKKIINVLEFLYSNAKLAVANNLLKGSKRHTFSFQKFESYKICIFSVLNIKKEKTKTVLSTD